MRGTCALAERRNGCRSRRAPITEVENGVPQPLPAAFESGEDAIIGRRNVASIGIGILQTRGGIEDGTHLLCIVGQVRGQLQFTAGLQQAAQ